MGDSEGKKYAREELLALADKLDEVNKNKLESFYNINE